MFEVILAAWLHLPIPGALGQPHRTPLPRSESTSPPAAAADKAVDRAEQWIELLRQPFSGIVEFDVAIHVDGAEPIHQSGRIYRLGTTAVRMDLWSDARPDPIIVSTCERETWLVWSAMAEVYRVPGALERVRPGFESEMFGQLRMQAGQARRWSELLLDFGLPAGPIELLYERAGSDQATALLAVGEMGCGRGRRVFEISVPQAAFESTVMDRLQERSIESGGRTTYGAFAPGAGGVVLPREIEQTTLACDGQSVSPARLHFTITALERIEPGDPRWSNWLACPSRESEDFPHLLGVRVLQPATGQVEWRPFE